MVTAIKDEDGDNLIDAGKNWKIHIDLVAALQLVHILLSRKVLLLVVNLLSRLHM